MEIIFGPEEAHGVPEMDQKSPEATTREGACPTPWAPPYLMAASRTPLTCSGRHHLLYIPKLPEHNLDQELPPQASVASENQSRPVLALFQRGESLSGGHLHHHGALHDEEGVVHPRG